MSFAERQLEETVQPEAMRTVVGVLPIHSLRVEFVLPKVFYLARRPLVRDRELNAVAEALRQRRLHVVVLQRDIRHARDRNAVHVRERPEQLLSGDRGAGTRKAPEETIRLHV